ncbi:MAG: rhodanese-like domain-containing protein [Spirochaetota bacterium]|nr:MAG: rhodanese-like domain-containing protein [Spirochaetota bacterium]
MRKKVSFLSIPLVIFILAFSTVVADKTLMILDITVSEAHTLIDDRKDAPDFIILDVRTEAEYLERHIESALNIDYRGEDFYGRLEELDRDDTYLLYCRSGRRSRRALEIMKELGFRSIYHLSKGFMSWQEEDLPFSK